MSEFGGASNHCNILDMINGDRSRDHPDNCTEFIVNADEDTILPPVDGGRQAWAFMIGAFMIEGLMWGKYFLSHLPLAYHAVKHIYIYFQKYLIHNQNLFFGAYNLLRI